MMQDFPPIFCLNMLLPWQHTFCHCQKKCVLHIYTPRQTSVPNFMRIGEKLSSSWRKIFPHFCHNMPLPWQHSFCHCRKMCLAHLHPKAHICAKFHENWSKTEEVVRDARLAPDRARPPEPTTRWFLYCIRHYFRRTVIFVVLVRCGNSWVVNFAILVM